MGETILEQFNQSETLANIYVPALLLNFIFCLAFSLILRSVYKRSALSITGYSQIANILPILSLIIFLIITVVKSSLALSLGLVGALSIVRFRTPIKEPQELIFLFAAIAIGLGYGAMLFKSTTLIASLILMYLYFFESRVVANASNSTQIKVAFKLDASNTVDGFIETLNSYSIMFEIIRIEISENGNFSGFFSIQPKDNDLATLLNSLKEGFPHSEISMMNDRVNW